MTGWQRLDVEAAFAVLRRWAHQRVIVSVDLAAGAPGLAGMAGVLRPVRRDGDGLTVELVDSEAWLRLPDAACFSGASHDPGEQVLVLEYAGEDPLGTPAVLVDVQLLHP